MILAAPSQVNTIGKIPSNQPATLVWEKHPMPNPALRDKHQLRHFRLAMLL
jgi:hypothetical protein